MGNMLLSDIWQWNYVADATSTIWDKLFESSLDNVEDEPNDKELCKFIDECSAD